MANQPPNRPENDDSLDPRVEAKFGALEQVRAPDVWSAVEAAATGGRGGSGRLLVGAVAAAVLVIGGVFGINAVLGRGDVADIATQPQLEEGDAVAPPNTATAGECSTAELVASLSGGLPTFDYEPSESPAALNAASQWAVRGEIITLGPRAGGLEIELKVAAAHTNNTEDMIGGNVITVWTPATEVPSALVRGSVVVFLTGVRIDNPQRPGRPGYSVDIEGLWVACDDNSPAASVIIEPVAPGWQEFLATEPSLNDLWDVVQFPEGTVRSALPLPTMAGGAAIYDVELVTGERFRMSLPATISGPMTMIQQPAPLETIIEGDGVSILISFQFCRDQAGLVENELGSEVAVGGPRAQVCRPDELLVMDVLAASGIEFDDGDRDFFDIRLIQHGRAYGPVLESAWPDLHSCGGCAPWGPFVFEEANVVVNRTGRSEITAVDKDTLLERWSFDSGAGALALLPGADGVWIQVDDGPVSKLDPATGEVVWQIDREIGERNASISAHGFGLWFLQSSFAIEGDDRAPTLRLFDPETGRISWTATGREKSEWQITRPIVLDGNVIVMDVADNPDRGLDPAGSTVLAFDFGMGELVWRTDVEVGTPAFDQGLLAFVEVETGPVVLARTSSGTVIRIDPATGAVSWQTDLPGALFGGTNFAPDGTLAIDVITPSGRVLLDPETGAVVDQQSRPLDFVCPVTPRPTRDFVPPSPWPPVPAATDAAWFGSDELWTVLNVGEHRPRKSVWWSANFPGGGIEEQPQIEVIYERLDQQRAPVIYAAPGTNAFSNVDGDFMINGIDPAESGCWRVTATYKGATLSYIYETP